MRTWWAALALAWLALAPAAAMAQTPADGILVLQDDEGDATLVVGGQPQPPPSDTGAETDLVSATVREEAAAFVFTVGVAAFRSDEYFGSQVLVYFRHHDTMFRASAFTRGTQERPAYLAEYDEGRGAYQGVAEIAAETDAAAATVTLHVPRSLLADGDGAAPFPGRLLEDFWAEAWTIQVSQLGFGRGPSPVPAPSPVLRLGDRMPDEGFGTVPFPVQLGLAQTGTAYLSSVQPFRASNGGVDGTFVFQVNATNKGPAEERFSLRAVGVPSGWDVRVPASTVEIPGSGSIEIPVVVRTQGDHQHGGTASFVLEMEAAGDEASVGRVELGLRYADPPQPAGHHSRLTIHSADEEASDSLFSQLRDAFTTVGGGTDAYLYMNAAADDGIDQGVPVKAEECNGFSVGAEVQSSYCWWIPLAPRLELGLDFDLAAGPARLTLPITAPGPLPAAQVSARLYYTYPTGEVEELGNGFEQEQWETVVLAESAAPAATDLAAGASAELEVELTPTPESDFVLWRPEAYMGLDVTVTTGRPAEPFTEHLAPELHAGGTLDLPLLEYEDPVSSELFGSGSAVLSVVGATEKMVNPGRTAVFNLTLRNDGELEETFNLAVIGPNAEWASIPNGGRLTVEAGGNASLQVVVAAPDGASDGTEADLLVEAASLHDANQRTLARVLATVDTDADHPDEAASIQEGAQKAPLPGPAAAVAALALAGLLWRRRA